MKLSLKIIISSIVLLMSMLLLFDVCFQKTSSTTLIELSDENHSNCIESDSELNEECQIVFAIDFLSTVDTIAFHNHFYFTSTSARPFFSVWQPPKLC